MEKYGKSRRDEPKLKNEINRCRFIKTKNITRLLSLPTCMLHLSCLSATGWCRVQFRGIGKLSAVLPNGRILLMNYRQGSTLITKINTGAGDPMRDGLEGITEIALAIDDGTVANTPNRFGTFCKVLIEIPGKLVSRSHRLEGVAWWQMSLQVLDGWRCLIQVRFTQFHPWMEVISLTVMSVKWVLLIIQQQFFWWIFTWPLRHLRWANRWIIHKWHGHRHITIFRLFPVGFFSFWFSECFEWRRSKLVSSTFLSFSFPLCWTTDPLFGWPGKLKTLLENCN